MINNYLYSINTCLHLKKKKFKDLKSASSRTQDKSNIRQ